MKYVITFFIALGITLSLVFGVKYNCEGTEMFPTYYGSPFIFKQKSLGSSMEYFFSISGLLLNVFVWCIIISMIRFGIKSILKKLNYKASMVLYKSLITFLVVFSIFNISIAYVEIGRGFEKKINYWYWDFDNEARNWGMQCVAKWGFFVL